MKKLSDIVFDTIKKRILDFTYLPGVRISDDEIATELQTSRTPVREALNRLVELGLVEAKLKRGFSVKTFSKNEIEDLYVLRDTLECLAVKLTIQKMDSKKEKKLKNILKDYPSLINTGNLGKFNQADTKFHDLIAFYSENYALHEYLINLYYKIQIIRRYDHLRPHSWEGTYKEHCEILEHIISRDIKKAQKSMSKHILKSMEIILKINE